MLRQIRHRAVEAYRRATDERYRAFHAQREIVDLELRKKAANHASKQLPRSPDAAINFDPAAVRRLAEAGWVGVPDLVPPEWLAEIGDYFADKLARDPYRPNLGRFKAPREVPQQTHVSHYDNEDIVRAPHLLEIANHPRVLGIVEGWMGAKPTLAALRVWWSTPIANGEAEHAELFHRDVDDLQFVKLFVYLSDVTEDTGPHIYVEGSQRVDRLTEIRRYSNEEVSQAFGAQAIRCFTGPAGTSFLENTYGMHRGLPPQAAPRLIFQPLYAQRPIIFGPKKPVICASDVGLDLDSYINRVFVRP